MLEELYLSDNLISKIEGLSLLKELRTLDLSKNHIRKLRGLEEIESLRFINLSLNQIEKVWQLKYIELLPLLTELDLCFNPVMNKKHYRLQVLYHIPQLRMVDGSEVLAEEKVKAENLHNCDLKDRELIFNTLLPQEKFVDRRICTFEDIEVESEDSESDDEASQRPRSSTSRPITKKNSNASGSITSRENLARSYVGELINRVEFNDGKADFIVWTIIW